MPFTKYGAVAYVVTFSNSSYRGEDCGVSFYVSKRHKDLKVKELKADGFTVKVHEVVLER